MDPITLISGASMLASGLGSLFGKKQKFEDTEYGKQLKLLSQRGMDISPIMGGIGSETGNAAAQAKVDLKGRLISQGMGGSIAGQASLKDIDVKRMDQLQKSMKQLQSENERLKAQYSLQYGQAATEFDMGQQQQKQDALSGLFGTSGQLFMESAFPQKGLGDLYKAMKGNEYNPPARPDMPLEAPGNYVMPKDIDMPPESPKFPVPANFTGMETPQLSTDFMRTSRKYGGYSNEDFDKFLIMQRYLNSRR